MLKDQKGDEIQLHSFTRWTAFNDQLFKRDIDILENAIVYENDSQVNKNLKTLLNSQLEKSQFIFVQYDEIDAIGHKKGFSSDFKEKVKEIDGYVGEILDIIENKQNEDWLVILVTDHGRDELGLHHGFRSEAPRREQLNFIGTNS